MACLYFCPSFIDFSDALVRTLISETQDNPVALTTYCVILPTRRAVRKVIETLRRTLHTQERALFLPSLYAARDFPEATLQPNFMSFASSLFPSKSPLSPDLTPYLIFDDQKIFPAISPLKRQGVLAQEIEKTAKALGISMTMLQAFQWAESLAHLLDDLLTEEISLERLHSLVPESYADHWKKMWDFLQILVDTWPNILAQEGYLENLERQKILLETCFKRWETSLPSFPILAAGLTGSVPLIRRLITQIHQMPTGRVLIQGFPSEDFSTLLSEVPFLSHAFFDPGKKREGPENPLPPSHPLFCIETLRVALNLSPQQVQLWPGCEPLLKAHTHPQRSTGSSPPLSLTHLNGVPHQTEPNLQTRALRHIFLSHMFSEDLPMGLFQGSFVKESLLKGIHSLTCATDQEEAETIALILRHTLETPHKTAALITPDRSLVRRVQGVLTQWNLECDDSAGIPLSEAPGGVFLRLTAQIFDFQHFSPLTLLTFLKHPLASGGQAPGLFKKQVRHFEIETLRGLSKEGFLDMLRPSQASSIPQNGSSRKGERVNFRTGDARDGMSPDPPRKEPSPTSSLVSFLGFLLKPLFPLIHPQIPQKKAPLKTWLQAHLEFSEQLSAPEGGKAGESEAQNPLWGGEEGSVLQTYLTNLLQATEAFPLMTGYEYKMLFGHLLKTQTLRKTYGYHPRLACLGPLEARLQTADVVILAGLNEGTWPQLPEENPWINPRMKRDMGFPDPKQYTGFAAHDFLQHLAAPEVYLTRSEKVQGAQTIPSRWWMRLDYFLKVTRTSHLLNQDQNPWDHRRQVLWAPQKLQKFHRPAPCPPVATRPRQLSVTEIDRWWRDPYTIYAKHILKLRPLPPLDPSLTPTLFGVLVHQALERYHLKNLTTEEELCSEAASLFAALGSHPLVKVFWWPRFCAIAKWFTQIESSIRPSLTDTLVELKGSLVLSHTRFPFTLTAKADRLDIFQDKTIRISDYKTGVAPRPQDIERGVNLQLLLEAAILLQRGFDPVSPSQSLSTDTTLLEKTDPQAQPHFPDCKISKPNLLSQTQQALKNPQLKDLAYWVLRGHPDPCEIRFLTENLEMLIKKSLKKVTDLVHHFDQPDTPYPALPKFSWAPAFSEYTHLTRVKEWSSPLAP